MDLVSLQNSWFPPFRGLHVAIGHSGTRTADTLDSVARGSQFAAMTAGIPLFFFPTMSVGDVWMATGTIDIQCGCCAVVIAAGNDRNDAIDRRENEHVKDGRPIRLRTGSPGNGSAADGAHDRLKPSGTTTGGDNDGNARGSA